MIASTTNQLPAVFCVWGSKAEKEALWTSSNDLNSQLSFLQYLQ